MVYISMTKKREPALNALKYLILPLLYICAAQIVPAQAQTAEGPHAQIRLVPERTEIGPGETIRIGIEQVLDERWHTYWRNPGDSGVAPEIEWTLPEGFTTGDILWPTPRKIPFGPLTNYGYEERVTLLQHLTAPAALPTGPLTLHAEVTVLVCADICIPETSTHTITLNEGHKTDNGALLRAAAAHLPQERGWPAHYSADNGNLRLTIAPAQANAFDDIRIETLALMPEEWGIVENSASVVASIDGPLLTLRQKRGDRALSEVGNLRILLAYADRNGDHSSIVLTAAPDQPADAVAPPASATADITGTANISFFGAVLFAILGGVILNLMPCVFPVLSLKAMSLSKMNDKEQAHAAASGFAYTAGVVLSFALIAGVLMVLKAAGAQIGWGFQLQNPTVVYGLALLLFVIGLSLSGVFSLQGSFTNTGHKLAAKSGLTGTFFTGVLATLVATPCTAPFMGVAMGYALTQSAFAGMAVFIALGFGLALPYLLLTLVPALRRLMPKPGPWMETFKEFLAFPMYASAAWLIWVLAQQTGSMSVLAALLGFVAVAFAFWAWRRRPRDKTGRLLVTAIIALALIGGLGLSFAETLKKVTAHHNAPASGMWQDFSQSRLDELLRGNGPVFVDMTAAWCITCKVNERVALDIPETQALFTAKKITALKGDWTNQNPEITNFLESHGRKGVPLYVFYGPRDPASGQRPGPAVLPQILTPAIVARAVQ